ncbi:hypothetical protein [Streptomyces camponoticapitis]|nr:hypothetical protein [Streptomyces camponoticapitis]
MAPAPREAPPVPPAPLQVPAPFDAPEAGNTQPPQADPPPADPPQADSPELWQVAGAQQPPIVDMRDGTVRVPEPAEPDPPADPPAPVPVPLEAAPVPPPADGGDDLPDGQIVNPRANEPAPAPSFKWNELGGRTADGMIAGNSLGGVRGPLTGAAGALVGGTWNAGEYVNRFPDSRRILRDMDGAIPPDPSMDPLNPAFQPTRGEVSAGVARPPGTEVGPYLGQAGTPAADLAKDVGNGSGIGGMVGTVAEKAAPIGRAAGTVYGLGVYGTNHPDQMQALSDAAKASEPGYAMGEAIAEARGVEIPPQQDASQPPQANPGGAAPPAPAPPPEDPLRDLANEPAPVPAFKWNEFGARTVDGMIAGTSVGGAVGPWTALAAGVGGGVWNASEYVNRFPDARRLVQGIDGAIPLDPSMDPLIQESSPTRGDVSSGAASPPPAARVGPHLGQVGTPAADFTKDVGFGSGIGGVVDAVVKGVSPVGRVAGTVYGLGVYGTNHPDQMQALTDTLAAADPGYAVGQVLAEQRASQPAPEVPAPVPPPPPVDPNAPTPRELLSDVAPPPMDLLGPTPQDIAAGVVTPEVPGPVLPPAPVPVPLPDRPEPPVDPNAPPAPEIAADVAPAPVLPPAPAPVPLPAPPPPPPVESPREILADVAPPPADPFAPSLGEMTAPPPPPPPAPEPAAGPPPPPAPEPAPAPPPAPEPAPPPPPPPPPAPEPPPPPPAPEPPPPPPAPEPPPPPPAPEPPPPPPAPEPPPPPPAP